MLIATLGVGIVWSELARLTQGAGQRWLSPLFATPVAIARTGEDFVTVTPMVVVATCLAASALGSVLMALARSTFGRRWRAVAEEPTAAALCGVSAERVLAQTMMVAAALAGLAGALTALHFGGVGSGGGLVIGLKALIAAVIGGIGSVAGAVAGAVVVGLAETAWSLAFPIEYRDLAMFAALAAVLVFRPEGPWRQDRW
jgi:branched-subunit amino acid ABC-type transport system permease component